MTNKEIAEKRKEMNITWRVENLTKEDGYKVKHFCNYNLFDEAYEFLRNKSVIPNVICSSCGRATTIAAYVKLFIEKGLI